MNANSPHSYLQGEVAKTKCLQVYVWRSKVSFAVEALPESESMAKTSLSPVPEKSTEPTQVNFDLQSYKIMNWVTYCIKEKALVLYTSSYL